MHKAFLVLVSAIVSPAFAVGPSQPVPAQFAVLPDGVTYAGPLLFASDGTIYGTSATGGHHRQGFIFMVAPDGTAKTLTHFSHKVRGAFPLGRLVESSDGTILGATIAGGAHQAGSIYSISKTGDFQTLYSFSMRNGFRNPGAGLVKAPWPPHPILGTAESRRPGVSPGVLFEFVDGSCRKITDAEPTRVFDLLVDHKRQEVIGIAESGGELPTRDGIQVAGCVFRYSNTSGLSTILSFPRTGGGTPLPSELAGLATSSKQRVARDQDGTNYFPTFEGGRYGEGRVLKVSDSGKATTLHQFLLHRQLGAPLGPLAVGYGGQLYGVIGPTYTYDSSRRRVDFPNGAVCRFTEKGVLEVGWPLESGGLAQSLVWHEGAFYYIQGNILYRAAFAPNAGS